jgi:hypothetical protein
MLGDRPFDCKDPRIADAVKPGCATRQGFSLHAGIRCGARQRAELEHLCCYITRPAIAK